MGAVGRAPEVRAVAAVAAHATVLRVVAVPVVLRVVAVPVLGVLALVTGAMVPMAAVVAVPQGGLVEPAAATPNLMKADARHAQEVRGVHPAARAVRAVMGGAPVLRGPVLTVRAALARRALRATTPAHLGRGHIRSGSQRRISRMTSRRRTSTERRVPACGPWPRTTRTA